ncbi:Na+/H+ antiporter NhaC family protein [Helicobacter kayseriensis]|uniref:Na+/H+ antiporter NhaC family protein n=1 Tax=Helicobacter kayseriensis TaxID=2905877 RepID=UPI001E4026E2|nr:Na+/H+ antiporter NhaC family protein [Helicobacter kayseriensis]MCE3047557.1 Na+/H+ antiporter NhaC family protein [Helicobacter kayseriensis]MCE3048879.1 Na+/H+ antiporter NhaC family protein [Helicobacter kayseriensis]
MNYSDTFFSLLVPLVVIGLVLLSKRIVLSLFVGIVLGGVMMHYENPIEIFDYVYQKVSSVFYSYKGGTLEANWYGIYVFLFLIILGILSQVVIYSGGVGAFVAWARRKVRDTKTSEFVAFFAGIVIFIDDYFNALTVGQIAKPLGGMYSSSRERLAYIIDSTSAPVCVIVPFSSWGAYIIGILQSNLPKDSNHALFVLLESIGSNFYAWFALIAVFLTILWQINLPAMRRYVNVDVAESSQDLLQRESKLSLLLIPIFVLIVAIVFMIFYTGYKASKSLEFFEMLANTDTAFALFCGGLIALGVSFVLSRKEIAETEYFEIVLKGIKSMLPAIVILVLAWAIAPVIKEDLQTGVYLGNLAKTYLSSHSLVLLPVFLFLISAFISFSTGTSWGCFAIMIPIAVELSAQSGGNAIIAISAVLSGAVYGDHTSPMSDTTILSSIGAGCSLQSHFMTQFPYAAIVAFFSFVAFCVVSLGGSTLLAFGVGGALLVVSLYYLSKRYGGELPIKK